jgi:hypothetical protein
MKLFWRISEPAYAVSEEDLSQIIWERHLGVRSYSEPMYQEIETVEDESAAVAHVSDDLNVTLRRGHGGPVIFKRHLDNIYKEGDEPFEVSERTFRVTRGNFYWQ